MASTIKDAANQRSLKPSGQLPSHAEVVSPAPLSPVLFQGKWDKVIIEYDEFLVEQVDCLNWKKALRHASAVARKLFLELSFCYAH
jgi:hypothetical protein